jgi:DNA-binding CsgD family transcriptional regulator
MRRASDLGSREGKVTFELLEALGSSLDIGVVLERAYPLLLDLVPADYGALGISSTGRPEDYAWRVAELPPAFFAAYPEMAPHDFVREAVVRKVNVVLRDEEMVPRAQLESNMMYRRAREVGAPLEQVMAVMLHVDERWQSGLSLFRERRRPFTVGEREALQRVTPALANAVRNCHLHGAAASLGAALELLLGQEGRAVVLATPPATEIARTALATAVLERWTAPGERRAGRLPEPLVAVLARAVVSGQPSGWEAERDGAKLTVRCVPFVAVSGLPSWMIMLEERRPLDAIPMVWHAKLTARELEVTAAVIEGLDNQSISEALGMKLRTTKTHLNHVFDKLGFDSRAALIARAAELRRQEMRDRL